MISMSWVLTLQLSGSPPVSVSMTPIDVQAIDRIEAAIAPGDNDKVLELQPGGLAAVKLLLIKSSSYGSHLKFKASDGTTDSSAVTLDSPQLFSGGGVALLGVAPHRLKFTNSSTDKPATVEVHVGREATP